MIWYTGENGTDSARSTATARVDPSITVSYGMRANEQGIRWIVQNIAALAAVTYSPTDPNAAAQQRRAQPADRRQLDAPARHAEDRGHRSRACRRADDACRRHGSPSADQQHALRHAASRSRACRRSRSAAADPGAADAPAGVAADDGAAVSDQSGQLPLSRADTTARRRPHKGRGRSACGRVCRALCDVRRGRASPAASSRLMLISEPSCSRLRIGHHRRWSGSSRTGRDWRRSAGSRPAADVPRWSPTSGRSSRACGCTAARRRARPCRAPSRRWMACRLRGRLQQQIGFQLTRIAICFATAP